MHALALGLVIAFTGDAAPPQGLTPMERYSKEIAFAEATGRSLFQFDQAASVATDEVLSRIDDGAKSELVGWICEPSEKGITTSFLVRPNGQAVGIRYSVLTSNGLVVPGTFKRTEKILPLTDRQREQDLARKLALETFTEPCSKDYNTVVLRNMSDSNPVWDVYLIPASEKPGVVLLGGFERFRISSDGTRILSKRKYTKSCLELPAPPNSQGLFTSHLLDGQPTEVHVYMGLINRANLYVATIQNACMWSVEQGTIRFLQMLENKK